MNLRDQITNLIAEEIWKTKVWDLCDRNRSWWRLSGKVIERISEVLEIDIDDGYDMWLKPKKRR